MAVTAEQRLRVSLRAQHRCEYCLLQEIYTLKKHEIDHIIPRKHGGHEEDSNLAWACFQCNRYKGSEVAAYDAETGELAPLFHPRRMKWEEHFIMETGYIVPLTSIGRVTVLVLQMNRPGRVAVRKTLSKMD